MKIYFYLCAALLMLAAGWSVRGWKDEAGRAEALAKAQNKAEQQRGLDEAAQARLAQRLTEVETSYANQAKDIPELPLLNPKFEALESCSSTPAFGPEFVRMWNSDPADAAGPEQTHRGDAALPALAAAAGAGGDGAP